MRNKFAIIDFSMGYVKSMASMATPYMILKSRGDIHIQSCLGFYLF